MTDERLAAVYRIAAEAASVALRFGGLDRETLIDWIMETGCEQQITRREAIDALRLTVGQVGMNEVETRV